MDQLLVEYDLALKGARRLSTERRVRTNGDQPPPRSLLQ